MKKETLLYGVIGLVVGATASGLIISNINKSNPPADMPMSNMADSLKGKTGDEFDKTFLSGMIVHHQDAVDMAKLAKDNAKHDQIKKMAEDIILVQSSEINTMQSWQNDWGYKNIPTNHDTMDH